MNTEEKLKYLIENYYEIIENKFEFFIFQVLKKDPKVTDISFKVDVNGKIFAPSKRIDFELYNIEDINVPLVDDSFYQITGFNQKEFESLPIALQAMGTSSIIEGLNMRSQLTNAYLICRIIYNNYNNKNPRLTESAKAYINRLFDSLHLSCQLERILSKSEIKEKKLKI